MKTNLFGTFFIFLISVTAFAQVGSSIDEGEYISIGGIEQWVTIKGSDRTKPAILFLHGGPGSVMSPYDEAIYGQWEKDFILVNWDQRGAGRTFGKNAPAELNEDYWIENPLTIEQMTSDGIELSEHLLKHLGKQKIILIGTSWGSVLGVSMSQNRPDLFYAYVGHSQVVNSSESEINAYQKLLKMAETTNDQTSLEKLKSLGSPPYEDAKNTGQFYRVIKKFESENSVPAPDSWWKISKEYDNEIDGQNRYDGDDYSFINFAGHKKLGIKSMVAGLDFMKDAVNFDIPVYLIQGEEDIITPKEISRVYFDKITAPKKEFFLVQGAAHGHNQSIIDIQFKIAKEKIALFIKE
jgi:pimeloyl-ACP methyl ester carboxylesterase